MADPVYPIYPAQEETAAVQKYLADKRAYDALAAQLPAIERKIAAQQKIAEPAMASRPRFATEDIFGLGRPVYTADQQWKAVQAIRGLEASRAEIQSAPKPNIGAVESAIRSTTPPELPSGVQEIVGDGTQKPQATAAPAAPAQPAPAPDKPQYDPFAEFKKQEDFRKGYWDFAMKQISSAPAEIRKDVAKVANDVFGIIAPKPPQNMAVPLIDAMTGKPLEGFALIGGKVEKIEKPKVEDDGRSVIGYDGKAPTQGEAVKFRVDAAETSEGIRALDELIQIGRKGSSLSPTDRARAQNLARMIQGRLRPDIVGPGAVSDPDRKVLEQVISNPLQIFTLVDIPSLLEDLKVRVISGQNTKAAILGLKPIGQQQQQQSAPGGVVNYMRSPDRNLISK